MTAPGSFTGCRFLDQTMKMRSIYKHEIVGFRLRNMNSRLPSFRVATLLILLGSIVILRAQVPPEFADLYPVMEADLTNFQATVDAGFPALVELYC